MSAQEMFDRLVGDHFVPLLARHKYNYNRHCGCWWQKQDRIYKIVCLRKSESADEEMVPFRFLVGAVLEEEVQECEACGDVFDEPAFDHNYHLSNQRRAENPFNRREAYYLFAGDNLDSLARELCIDLEREVLATLSTLSSIDDCIEFYEGAHFWGLPYNTLDNRPRRERKRWPPGYRIEQTLLEPGVVHGRAMEGKKPLSYASVLELLQRSYEFRRLLMRKLDRVSFAAYRWETPPVDQGSLDRAFEYVCIDSPELVRSPDRQAFAEHFTNDAVVSFSNLGGDAVMVVPCPDDAVAGDVYAHLASFLDGAPLAQQHTLWKQVGDAMCDRVAQGGPVWLSTAGAGVAWLHVRLDDRPKYYRHRRYAKR